MNDEQIAPIEWLWYDARAVGRHDIRQPVSGKVRVRLIDLSRQDSERAEVLLTVPQALEAIEQLTRSVRDVCRRSDISDALHSTHTGIRGHSGSSPQGAPE